MIEKLPDMPAGVLGIRVSGNVSGEEIRDLVPTLGDLNPTDLRIVEVIESDYEGFGPGGLVEDLRTGLRMLVQDHAGFDRIAVVSDLPWVNHVIHAVGWLVPGELQMFGLDDLEAATTWAAADN